MILVLSTDERSSRCSAAALSANSFFDKGRSASGQRQPSFGMDAASLLGLSSRLTFKASGRSFRLPGQHSSSSRQHPSRCARMILVLSTDELSSRCSAAARSANFFIDSGRSTSDRRESSPDSGAENFSGLPPLLDVDAVARPLCLPDLDTGPLLICVCRSKHRPSAPWDQEIGENSGDFRFGTAAGPKHFASRRMMCLRFGTMSVAAGWRGVRRACETWVRPGLRSRRKASLFEGRTARQDVETGASRSQKRRAMDGKHSLPECRLPGLRSRPKASFFEGRTARHGCRDWGSRGRKRCAMDGMSNILRNPMDVFTASAALPATRQRRIGAKQSNEILRDGVQCQNWNCCNILW